jgi:DNA-binding MarR family transcriptional regulator
MSTFAVLDAYSKLRREVSRIGSVRLKDNDLGLKQMVILYHLMDGPRTMSELAELAQSDKSSATRTVDALARAGWVKRGDDEGDRRKRVICLTAKGRQKAAKAQEVRQYIGLSLEETLTAKEREALATLLDKVSNNLLQKRKV